MYEFRIDAMSCGHCIREITRVVREADPAAQVDADLAAHRVRVDTVAPREALESALAEAGYPVAGPA